MPISRDIILAMANEVRELREAAGLSQEELSLRSGVAQPNIAAYESGWQRASAAMIERLRGAARPLPSEALARHRDELVALAHQFGLSNLRVFGSSARGADHPGSDLGLLVTRSEGLGLLTLVAFTESANELLGVDVDVVTAGALASDHEILEAAIAI